MANIIIGNEFRNEEIAPGVRLEALQPGGRRGPNDLVLTEVPGGAVWTQSFVLGDSNDEFTLSIPDIRMPPNQIWPLHWHDCWIAVIVVDGSCIAGDWWMKPGDVLISAAELEYGPIVIGPEGCQMFEIFAQDHLAPGGYAPEYRDHPTLVYAGRTTPFVFKERSSLNQRNNGKQTLPVDGTQGLIKGRLDPGKEWDLGEAGTPSRGLLRCVGLGAGDRRSAATYADWHATIVMDGAIRLDDRELGKGAVIIAKKDSKVPAIESVQAGTQLLEIARTARGMDPVQHKIGRVSQGAGHWFSRGAAKHAADCILFSTAMVTLLTGLGNLNGQKQRSACLVMEEQLEIALHRVVRAGDRLSPRQESVARLSKVAGPFRH